MVQMEVRSIEFLVFKQWLFAVVVASHEKRLQKAIDDERQMKSINEWSELRRQVKEYRKFIFIAAINEQGKGRLRAAFLHWRGEVKIWALQAHILAMQEEIE